MADQFQIIPHKVRSAGTDVPPEEVQAAVNSLALQTTVALNAIVGSPEPPSGPAGGDLGGTYPNPTVTGLHVTSGSASGVAITGSTLNSTPIGGASPNTGAFTTLTATTPVGVASGGTGQNSLSAHNVLIGGGTGAVGFAAPSTAGGMLISQGAAADPAFGNNPTITGGSINSTPVGATTPSTGAFTTLTATTPVGVASGGTGRATLLAHGVLVGEGTAGINQLAVGNTGQMLLGSSGADPGFGNNPIITAGTINGAVIGGTTPAAGTFTNLTASGTLTGFPGRLLNVQVITATQTYTPTTGTNSVVVELQAAGGGTGGIAATGVATVSASTGSGAGAYAKVYFTTGFSGVTVTIGAAGTAGAATPTAGGNASASSFGALISCPGGNGTGSSAATGTGGGIVAGAAQTAAPTISGGTTIVSVAGAGTTPSIVLSSSQALSFPGANSMLGVGGSQQNTNTQPASQGSGFGAGASSAINGNSQAAQAGAAGRPAVCLVYEFA